MAFHAESFYKERTMQTQSMNPIQEMQKAVDVVNTSLHPEHKIAATLFGVDHHGHNFSISHTNYWPDSISAKIGTDKKVGNSSGTIHAETACILAAPLTNGANLCITDPFCPNCAKNIAEAGIANIYIDHKGLDKEWMAANQEAFASMSLRICARAGINVYEVNRKAQTITPIYEAPRDYKPLLENPVTLAKIDAATAIDFTALITEARNHNKGHEFALCLAEDPSGAQFLMTARRHAAIGYSRQVPSSMEGKQGKYSFIVQPVTRLLMNAPRFGLRITDGYVFTTRVPTAREQVNMVGTGLSAITIANPERARDKGAIDAMKALSAAHIIDYKTLA